MFHPGSFTPIAQLDSIKERSCYFVLDVRGAPRAAYNSEGKVIWEAHLSAFGKVRWQEGNPELVKHHLLGQYSDEETGLFYNRFRYFDPDLCGYISPDPIGLAGGLEPWNYPTDPFTWADPFGLVKEGCGRSGSGTKKSKNQFPENPHELTDQLGVEPVISKTKEGTTRMKWEPNQNTQIRYESHPHDLKPGDPGFNPRHHGEHYHVTTRKDPTKSFGNRKNSTKIEPEGYQKGDGTGFIPSEPFPGSN